MNDDKLKHALAKMLPELLEFYKHEQEPLWWETDALSASVLDTELLHLCALAEDTLSESEYEAYGENITTNAIADRFRGSRFSASDDLKITLSATWQQRATALAKVKGIEV